MGMTQHYYEGLPCLERQAFTRKSSKIYRSRLGNGHLQDVRSLRPLCALHDFELDTLPLFQGFESFSLQRRIMDENVIPALKTNEPESLAIVEPFDGTFCLHGNTPFLNDHDSLRGRSRNSAGDTHDDEEKKKEET